MNRIIVIFFIGLFSCGCDQDQNLHEAKRCFFDAEHQQFAGYKIIQFGRKNGCLVNIEHQNGYSINLVNFAFPKRKKSRYDLYSERLIDFCKKTNLYYYNNNGVIFAKSNNSFFNYKQLKKIDPSFFSKEIDNTDNYNKELFCISYVINPSKNILDSISEQTKVYRFSGSKYYYWERQPSSLNCKNCLIRCI